MSGSYADMETVIVQADLSQETSREILAILKDDSAKIQPYKALRLLRLLSSLKTGHFQNLASEKKSLLQNFTALLRQDHINISRICYLFFDQTYPQRRRKHQLPEELVKKLITAGKMERIESVKAIVWDLLWTQGVQLARLITPEDLTFALWLDDPLTRNKLIMFMFRYFNAERVVEAICKYTSVTGKKIPANVSMQFIGLAREQTELKYRGCLLSNILTSSHFTNEDIPGIWDEYLRSRNRFELIKIFSASSDNLGWMEDLKGGRGQLSFNFKPREDISSITGRFASRLHAIQTQSLVENL